MLATININIYILNGSLLHYYNCFKYMGITYKDRN